MDSLGKTLTRFGFALVWVTLPFTAGPAFADALDPRSTPVRTLASIGLWGIWALALVGGLVPRSATLTLIRIVAPASMLVAVWSLIVVDNPGAAGASALGFTFATTLVALLPLTADLYVNGSSYGAERRLALRPPGMLLLGPIEITWLAVVAGVVTGPLLLASRIWVVGAVVLVVGWAVAGLGVRSLHVLARRWVVFVPAGVVIVDRLTLADALLMQRSSVAAIGPAPADTVARDLTAGALGLALQIDFDDDQTLVPMPPRRLGGDQAPVSVESARSVLFSPGRPGAVLAEAHRRGLPLH